METNAKYLLVGTSFIAMVALLIGSLLWLRKNSSDAGLSFYEVYFHHQSLAGLQEGSIVTMKGIPTGSVRSIKFDRMNTERVRVAFAVRDETPVKTDSLAVVTRNLVTGLAAVDLSTGSKDAQLLKGADRSNGDYPSIREGVGEFEGLKNSAPALLDRSAETLALIQRLLSDENRARVEEILKNVSELTRSLASQDGGIQPILRNAEELIRVGKETVISLEKTTSEVQRTLLTISRQLGDAVTRVSVNVGDAARRISDTAQRYQDPQRIITGPAKQELGPGEERR